jgi:hypothetical protein
MSFSPSNLGSAHSDVSRLAPSPTIRVIRPTKSKPSGPDSSPELVDPPSSSSKGSRTPTLTPTLAKSASMSRTPGKRTPRSLFSSRDRDKFSPHTPSCSRPRGKTVPAYTSELGFKSKTPEKDSDSVLSLTPSSSSRHIASWFSGLLGRWEDVVK